ncbi:P-loop ATPase, Sll1717 family [Rhizobium ruizarguesonis]|uniref:KAP NTPase domain-containing protein n=1 Tax=Rhizobium ruizarguesonis TaxID=2081791 RepID=A0ABY1X7F6_9HYPH|nr:hypothetical protein [Rhizobium ruizarguesonis]TAX81162.1 hypothetical protein ELH98_08830 [Rhizobium ruizarguesonis]TBE22897.1 hypothetical protein ELH08_08315 [Rhizobium ruizarguesonis]
MVFRTAFFAHPGSPPELARTIQIACDKAIPGHIGLSIVPWPQMDVFGQSIGDKVREDIAAADILVGDITVPNLNVYYEIGYAIGQGKSVAPVVNMSFAEATRGVQSEGFFDTIAYRSYENADQLSEIFNVLPNTNLVELYARPLNTSQPLYLLDTVRKTDFRNAIVSTIKDSKVFYRSFDPIETFRFSTITALAEISASAGVVIPLLSTSIDDAARHNLRAAFMAGISHGMGKKTLLLQLGGVQGAIPADYRDLVQSFTNEADTIEAVKAFCTEALLATQQPPKLKASSRTKLQALSLGASAAENEFRTLENYFVETSEYVRTLRGEVTVVSGRKGSGKTAIFFMVRDAIRSKTNAQVTDLKPESHQLSLFRQELLKLVDLGVFDHTIAAFWYFVFLSEMLFTIKRHYEHRSSYDGNALKALIEIDEALDLFGITDSGDFTARINRLSRSVTEEINAAYSKGSSLQPHLLTNIVFRGGINRIKQLIVQYSDPRTNILLLFDNIDKGWPTKGVEEFDVRMIRIMVESLDKIRRDLDAADRRFTSVVFLRNDIYELMVEQTPDRGKAGQIRMDWNDPEKLRQVIYRRLESSTGKEGASFPVLWLDHFDARVEGMDSFDYCVEHCLMRPRFLITIVENAIANAINRGNPKVKEGDLIAAVRQHSNYLISEFGFEIRDASGLSADILYEMIGLSKHVTKEEVLARFTSAGLGGEELEEAFTLMLWYGVIGIVRPDGTERYIYDYDYSIKRLRAEAKVAAINKYSINSAIQLALN